MAVSKAVRMALKRAGLQNGDLARLWGYTTNAVSNKFAWERWTGKELSDVAELTGGQLAFIYPDGTQITIPQEDQKKEKSPAEPRKAKAPVKTQGKKAPAKTQEKKAPPKQKKEKKEKKPEVLEEQISFFNLT